MRLSMFEQVLRRRWRMLIALTVVGAVFGAAASLLWPASYESSSQVLIQGASDKDRMASEAQIAMSLVVLDRVAAGLKWGVDGPALRDSVTAAVADGNVIEIKATAGTPDKARELADGVTQRYIAFSTEILTKTTSASIDVLTPRKDSIQKQIADLDRRIGALQQSAGTQQGTQGATTRAELDQLNRDRTEAVNEMTDLDGQIAKAQAQAAVSRENFSIIEPPVTPPARLMPVRLDLVAGGAAIVPLLGLFAQVIARRTDQRLRHCADITAALGAPVLGAVEARSNAVVPPEVNGSSNGHRSGGPLSLLQRLLRNGGSGAGSSITASGDPSLEYLRYRRVLARLPRAADELLKLLVVVAERDEFAARAVGELVKVAAREGRPVAVVTSSPALARAVNACVDADRLGTNLSTVEIRTNVDQAQPVCSSVLSVVTVSVARPTVPDWAGEPAALVVVTSGTRTAWELFAIAEACRDAGHSIAGALVVLPAADDEDTDPEQLRLSTVGALRDRPGRDSE